MSATACSPASKKRIIEFIKNGLRPNKEIYNYDTDHHYNDTENSINEYDELESEETLPIIMGYLSPKLKEEAKNKLKETEEIKEKSLKELRELIYNEPGLKSRMDDNFLIQFLRARKYNLKRAFKLLQNYYKFRKEYAATFDTTDADVVFKLIMKSYLGLIKRRDRNGSAIYIVKFGMWDPEVDVFDDLFRAITGILVFAIEDPATQVAGFRVIIDANKISWKQLKYCTPQNALLCVRSTQFCFPARYKGIHIVNANKFFHLAWAIVHPFLTSKLKKRIHIHGQDLTSLQDYITPIVLPEEYGGLSGPFDNSDWNETIKIAEKLLLDMMQYGYK